MNILGISAYYHDSAACLVRDGEIVAAAQEERFTRRKHDATFPHNALSYCLAEAGIAAADLDFVVYYEKPVLKFDRLVETQLAFWPRGFGTFAKALPRWLKERLFTARSLYHALGDGFHKRLLFLEHHESHAASAFFPSPYDEAAILTLDGVGEWATASIAKGDGNTIELLQELRFPHSLGLLYSAFTSFCGFKVNSGEYKLMGLAPFGEPVYQDLILEVLVDLKPDGSFRLNMEYFGYCTSNMMTSKRFQRLFGGPPRAPEAPITQREMNLAASVQRVVERIMLQIATHAHSLTGSKHLVLAGGVALNCVANGRLQREGPFESVWVQPAAGDAGAALGAALFVWYQLLKSPRRRGTNTDDQKGSFLGPQYSTEEVRTFLDSAGATYRFYEDSSDLAKTVAALLAEGRVVGHFAGRMEYGPRALGARSILGDARRPDMQRVMNLKVKMRESFRPFAPAVLRERANEFFELGANQDSPYMLIVAPVRTEKRTSGQDTLRGLDRVNGVRSCIPAVTHLDYSARVQTVDEQRHPQLHRQLRAFEDLTGCPLLVNTSFNVRGEPIVNTPADAYRCFVNTEMDVLAIEQFVLLREEQPERPQGARELYTNVFPLD